jgi:hypothetical protein
MLLCTATDRQHHRATCCSACRWPGLARAFQMPAQQALTPCWCRRALLARAMAVNARRHPGGHHRRACAGRRLFALPAPATGYAGVRAAVRRGCEPLCLCHPQPNMRATGDGRDWGTLLAGVRFLWQRKVLLGAISLDLFAVLLGGATALLPIFAKDILQVGPWGWACCAPRLPWGAC